MGLDANYPAVEINDPRGSVPIYNDDHLPVGALQGDRIRTNVVCLTKKWDDQWFYKQMNPAANDIPSRNGYIPADQVHVIHNPHAPNPVPECKTLTGCFRKATAGAVVTTAVGAGIRQLRRRRRTA